MKTVFDLIYEANDKEIKSLVAAGYDLNKSFDETDEGKTPLMTATELKDSKILHLLIDLGADIHQTTGKRGDSALTWCSKYGTPGNLRALALEDNFDINTKNKQGNSPLLLSAFIGNTEMFKAILDYKPDLNLRNHANQTVFEITSHDFGHERTEIRDILCHELTRHAIRKIKI